MAAKLTRLSRKVAIQLHLVTESYTIRSSHSRRSVRKLLDTSFFFFYWTKWRDTADMTPIGQHFSDEF
jgi:hypothetical protein